MSRKDVEEIDILTDFFENILNLIYPPICGICGKFDSNFLCKKCEITLKKHAVFGINKDDNLEDSQGFFEEHLYLFLYEGIVRKMILNYKFKEKAYLYKTFVNFSIKNKNVVDFIKTYDIIIPVPISRKRNFSRGYNQSLLIAKELSKKLNIELNDKCLYKVKDRIEQSKLNKQEREKNLIGAYQLRNKYKIENKKILLVDDIYTTGSTVRECCKMLKLAQIKQIGILTIAKD